MCMFFALVFLRRHKHIGRKRKEWNARGRCGDIAPFPFNMDVNSTTNVAVCCSAYLLRMVPSIL